MKLKLTGQATEGFLTHQVSEFPNGEPMPITINTTERGIFLLSDTARYVLKVDPGTGERTRFCKASAVRAFSDRMAGKPIR